MEDLLTPEPPEQDTDLEKKYGNIIKKQREQVPLKASFSTAQDIPQNTAGDIIDASKRTKLDRDTVRDDFDNIKKSLTQPTDKEIDNLQQTAPKVSKWLQDPYNASATQNDREHLKKLEQSLAQPDPLAMPRSDEAVVAKAEKLAQLRYDELVAEEGKSFISPYEGEYITTKTRTPEERAKLKLKLVAEEIAKQREQERFISSSEPLSPGDLWNTDVWGTKNLFKGIPFLNAVGSFISADEKAQREARMSPLDQEILLQQKRLEAAAERRGTSFGTKVTNAVTGLTELGGELAATGGASLVPSIGKGMFGKFITKGLEIGAQTALTQPLKIAANTIIYGTPETSVTQDENGDLKLELASNEGQKIAVPFMKAVASSLIDVGSANLPFHPAFKFWAKTAKVNPTVENFLLQYAKGGVESVLGGIAIGDATKLAKEIVGLAGPVEMPTTIKALMGDKEAMQEVGAQALVFGLAGVGGTAVQRQRAKAELVHGEALSYKDWFKDMSATVKEMESHASHPEVVADAIKGMVAGTDKEFTPLDAQVFADHYSKLDINPHEFATELTGRPDALQDALDHKTKLQVPTDKYLTKIGATDAGPVFEMAGLSFDPNTPPVDEAKQHIAELDKEQEAAKKQKPTADEAQFQEQIKALGESLQERAKAQNVDLAKYVEQGDALKAKRAVSKLQIATDSVHAAREDMGQAKPMLSEIKNLAMNPKEAEAYNKLLRESQDAAYEAVDADALAELNKDRKKQFQYVEEQVRDGLRKEVERLPEFQAESIMETGLDAEGNIVHEGGIKFDRETLKATHNETTIEGIPRKLIATSKEHGYTPDEVADMLGFSSGDELVRRLSDREPMESIIDRRTNEIMSKMRLNDLAELPEKAKEAVHNDQEAKVKAFQIKWLLENRLGQMKGLLRVLSNPKKFNQEAREYAEAKIAKNSDRTNDPRLYEDAERRANKDAREALLSGDMPEAAKQMELELLNHEMYRAAKQARKDANRIREYAAEFNKSDKRRLLFTAGEQYLAQSDALLERFSFKKQSELKIEKLASLKEFVENDANEGYIAQIPEKLLKESYRQNWRDVPIDDLRAIETTLKQLENNAKLKNEIIEGREKKDRNALAGEIAKQIRSSKKALEKPIDSYDQSEESKRTVRDLGLSPRNDASIYREMDQFQDGGIMQQTFSRRLNEAGAREAVLNEKATVELDKIYSRFSAAERFMMNRKKYIPEIGGSLNTWQRMEIVGLLGQKGARQRFLDGRGWGDAHLEAIVNSLSEKQVRWIDDVHKFLKTYELAVKEQIERRTGLPAKMVEAEPIVTKYGTLDGGYFPFKYDPRYDPQTGKLLDIDEAKRTMQGVGVQVQTKHGFTEQRAEAVKGKRLRFDAGVLFEHIREVNHDLAWSETLRDLSGLLKHKEVSKAITEHYGDQTLRQLSNSLHDIAVGEKPAANAFEKFLNWLRQGSTTAALGWNFTQAVTDFTGLSQGAARIGTKWMAEGAKKVLGDAVHMESAFKEMMDLSEQQRLRSKTFMREINEVRNKVDKQGTLSMLADMGLEKATLGKLDVQDIHNSFYYMMTKVQLAQEAPLWWGALEKAKAEKPLSPDATPAEAKKLKDTWVSMADQAVLDTYGGGQIKDLAPIMKGGSLQKLLFATFYTYANRTFNLMMESGIKFARGPKSIASVGRLAADMALLYAVPAIATFAIKSLVTQNDKDIPKRLGGDILGQVAGSVPVLREAVPALSGRDYSGPAGLRFFGALAGFGKSAYHGKMDWHDLNQAGGILFHYPALQLQRFIDGMESWLDHGRGTPLSPFFGPPSKRR